MSSKDRSERTQGEVTELLVRWSQGDSDAADELLPLVYRELRQAASACLRGERAGHTLQTTDLIHEVYLRLFDAEVLNAVDRTHFLRLATRVMHRVLVDYARKQMAEKRIGPDQRLPIEEGFLVPMDRPDYILRVHDSLEALKEDHPEIAQVVELRFFGGFSESEAADILEKSRSTVSREWRFAKIWLHKHMTRQVESD